MSYISRFETSSYSCYTYDYNTIYIDGNLLSEVLFPGLLHELKLRLHNNDILKDLKTSPSKYTLPSYIEPIKLIEYLRTTIGSTLVFIITYLEKKSPHLLKIPYPDYETFFISILTYIITNETHETIIDLARNLKKEIKTITPYFTKYHGYFPNNIIKTHILLQSILLYYLYNNL